ncbi:MAG: YetF domain-containing protein [Bacillota bacterium]
MNSIPVTVDKATDLTKDLIMDGKIMHENLKESNLSEEWLLESLKNRGKWSRKIFFTPDWTLQAICMLQKRLKLHRKDMGNMV